MALTPTRFIWMNGTLKPWEEATTHVLTHALHYGSAVFEGIRCYETPDGPRVFRVGDHITRMFQSGRVYHIDIPFTRQEIGDACKTVLASNELGSAIFAPLPIAAMAVLVWSAPIAPSMWPLPPFPGGLI